MTAAILEKSKHLHRPLVAGCSTVIYSSSFSKSCWCLCAHSSECTLNTLHPLYEPIPRASCWSPSSFAEIRHVTTDSEQSPGRGGKAAARRVSDRDESKREPDSLPNKRRVEWGQDCFLLLFCFDVREKGLGRLRNYTGGTHGLRINRAG